MGGLALLMTDSTKLPKLSLSLALNGELIDDAFYWSLRIHILTSDRILF